MNININGLEVHYLRGGNVDAEKTVFIMHGSNMCGAMLEAFLELLPEYNVILPDIIGHGETGGVTPKTVAEQTAFIEALLLALKAEGVIGEDVFVAGYSLGGALATEIGVRNLPFVTGIGVIDSCDFANTELPALVAEDFAEFEVMKALGKAFGPKMNPAVLEILGKYPQTEETAHADLVAASRYAGGAIEEINVPVLFVTADHDLLAPIDNVLEQYKKAKQARLAVIPAYGHMAFLEAPEFYAEAIRDIITYGVISK